MDRAYPSYPSADLWAKHWGGEVGDLPGLMPLISAVCRSRPARQCPSLLIPSTIIPLLSLESCRTASITPTWARRFAPIRSAATLVLRGTQSAPSTGSTLLLFHLLCHTRLEALHHLAQLRQRRRKRLTPVLQSLQQRRIRLAGKVGRKLERLAVRVPDFAGGGCLVGCGVCAKFKGGACAISFSCRPPFTN